MLLHMCCGPCAVYPVKILQDENINFTGFFYNPNIHPIEEHELRMKTLKELAQIKGFDVIYDEGFEQNKWEEFLGNKQERCCMCYQNRLLKTAILAKEKGFDAFSTTLLISPYQNQELIKNLGEEIGKKIGVQFYYRDFRPVFRLGQSMAKEMGLYRQKYCGCIISKYGDG